MVKKIHFRPKFQTHKILNKYTNFSCIPSLHWWNVLSSSFCIILNPKLTKSFFTPNLKNLPYQRARFFILDQKSKLTKFSINIQILVAYPVSTDEMSSIVCSVSFGTNKSIEVFLPKTWKFDHTGMADFFHFGLKIQTPKILNKSKIWGCIPSFHW